MCVLASNLSVSTLRKCKGVMGIQPAVVGRAALRGGEGQMLCTGGGGDRQVNETVGVDPELSLCWRN